MADHVMADVQAQHAPIRVPRSLPPPQQQQAAAAGADDCCICKGDARAHEFLHFPCCCANSGGGAHRGCLEQMLSTRFIRCPLCRNQEQFIGFLRAAFPAQGEQIDQRQEEEVAAATQGLASDARDMRDMAAAADQAQRTAALPELGRLAEESRAVLRAAARDEEARRNAAPEAARRVTEEIKAHRNHNALFLTRLKQFKDGVAVFAQLHVGARPNPLRPPPGGRVRAEGVARADSELHALQAKYTAILRKIDTEIIKLTEVSDRIAFKKYESLSRQFVAQSASAAERLRNVSLLANPPQQQLQQQQQ